MFLTSYPVDLIKVIGLHDPGRDDTGAVSGTELDIDVTEENIEITLDGGSISLLGNLEKSTKVSAVDGTGGGSPPIEGR